MATLSYADAYLADAERIRDCAKGVGLPDVRDALLRLARRSELAARQIRELHQLCRPSDVVSHVASPDRGIAGEAAEPVCPTELREQTEILRILARTMGEPELRLQLNRLVHRCETLVRALDPPGNEGAAGPRSLATKRWPCSGPAQA